MRRLVVAIGVAAMLAGCPIPQPVPDYPAGSKTPPRIVMDRLPLADRTIIYVPGDCPDPTFELSATLDDVDTIEKVVARWFVNYVADERYPARYSPAEQAEIPGNAATGTLRTVPSWTFRPFGGYGTATDPNGIPQKEGAVQVVELVVSGSFDDTATELPKRTPAAGFETQVYRWIFVTKNPGGSLPCPSAP